MEDIFVARLMSSGVISVNPDTLVEDAADTLLDKKIGSLVVVDGNNQLKGILTSTDFVRIVRESKPKAQTTVERYMTDQVVTVGAQDSIRDAADKMITYNIHHLPVVDDEEGVIGMLSTTDLTAYLSDVEQPSPA
jgi:CBS domain-containing protein